MSKPPVIRPGDQVRILKPIRVLRVGYPKGIEDYEKAVDTAALARFLVDTAPKHFQWRKDPVDTREGRAIRRQLALVLAQQDGFGGKQRTLHTEECPEALNAIAQVISVRSVRTGTYYPPSSYQDWESGHTEYEPGGLTDAKMHRLLSLDLLLDSKGWFFKSVARKLTWFETERTNVELVEKAE